MHRILVPVFALFMIANLHAQDSKALLKVSPIQFSQSQFELSYEQFFSGHKKSLHISPTFYLKKDNQQEFSGVQLELQYRIYLANLKREETSTWIFSDIRLFTGVYANGIRYNEDFLNYYYDPFTQMSSEAWYNKTTDALEGGILVGTQFLITDKVSIDLLLGGGIRYSENSNEYEDLFPDMFYDDPGVFDVEYFGVKPKLNLQIGITL